MSVDVPGAPPTAPSVHLPGPADVRDLLAALLGRDVVRTDGRPVVPGTDRTARVALYVDDRNQPAAVAVCDLAFGVHVSAALSVVPAARAREHVEHRTVPPALEDVLHEVFNVLAAAFNTDEATHVRLAAVYDRPEDLPVVARDEIGTPGGRIDHQLVVDGYGTTALSVVVLDRSLP